ncbi:MAG: hypothetical protein JOY86_05865, partial [Candidatus Eremiobacteraeota bacterium]|nr:hypothetical protein [Candidatus Eremiobacteraeota bacterium]
MPAFRRATAVLLAIAAAAGLTLAFERSHLHQGNSLDPRVLAFHLGDVRGDFSIGGPVASADDRTKDLSILDISMEKVHEHFYKPVDDTVLLKGERTGLTQYLSKKHVTATIPLPETDGVLSDDTALANKMLTDALDKYGSAASDDDLTFAAVSGMLDSLGDPYTVFLSPREIQSLNELIRGGDFGGIGIYI